MLRRWHPDDGFRVYDERQERFLTGKEIDNAHLSMRHNGALIRDESYIGKDGEIVRYVREPRDLLLCTPWRDAKLT